MCLLATVCIFKFPLLSVLAFKIVLDEVDVADSVKTVDLVDEVSASGSENLGDAGVAG